MCGRTAIFVGVLAASLGGAVHVSAQTRPVGSPPSKLRLPPRSDEANSPAKSFTAPTASLWGTVGALVLVLGGLAIAARYLKQHGPAALRTLPAEAVEPLGQRQLARGVTVHLVRCGSRVLLVGVGSDGVRTLSEITDPTEVDLITGACRRGDGDRASFAKLFRSPAATAAFDRPTARGDSVFPTRPSTLEVESA